MRVSFSMLNMWMQCPLQARFHYVDKLERLNNSAASFGNCIHHSLEMYNKTGDVDGALKEFARVWEEPELIGAGFDYYIKGTSYGSYYARGVEILREYHEKQKWNARTILATEHPFLVPLGEHELVGFVDLVEMRRAPNGKDTIRIIDYKTSKKAPWANELRFNQQFTAYLWAADQEEFWLGNGPDFPPMANGEFLWGALRDTPRIGIWYHLNNNKELSCGERTDEDYMRLYRAVCEIDRAIQNKVYVPDISGETCGFCPYTEPCGLAIDPKTYKAPVV